MPITHDRLLELVHYDPEMGVFTWTKTRPRCEVGERVGYLHHKGYWVCEIDGRYYAMHRLAWFYMTGEWPKQVDHRNRQKADNRWCNLREATNAQNQANSRLATNRTGFKGVRLLPPRNGRRYMAQIHRDGRIDYLGVFHTPEEAHAAYARAAQVLYGEFVEHLSHGQGRGVSAAS